jgi:hypothetical protein
VDDVTPEGRAATRLLADRHVLADEVTRRLYDEMPELTDRYGPVGREKCQEDIHSTIDRLIPAVDLGRPALFAGYVQWLDQLLRARNVTTREIVRSLELTEEVVRTRLSADEANVVATSIRAGLAELHAETSA